MVQGESFSGNRAVPTLQDETLAVFGFTNNYVGIFHIKAYLKIQMCSP